MVLTEKEKEEIYLGLSARCGFIETGTRYRAKDFENIGKRDQIKVLALDQMKKVIFLEELMYKILNT